MARRGGQRLSDNFVKGLRPRERLYRVGDDRGIGLVIEVTPSGSKLWRLRYRLHGRERMLALGRFGYSGDAINTASALQAAHDARAQIAAGVDPVVHRRVTAVAARASADATFGALAREWLDAQRPRWSARHYAAQERLLATDLRALAAIPVVDVTPPLLLTLLREVAGRAPEMAAKARRAAAMTFDFAIATGRATSNPAAPLRRALPSTPSVPRAALPYSELSTVLAAVAAVPAESSTRRCMAWLVLSAARSGEARGALWTEVYEDRGLWTIPASRMKAARDHLVPLTEPMLRIIALQRGAHDSLLFPGFGRRNGGGLSENALLALLVRGGLYGRQTAHGFRSMFSSWAHDSGRFDSRVVEMALAHVDPVKVRGVYDRADRLDARRALLDAWGAFCVAAGIDALID
jgi:integrase